MNRFIHRAAKLACVLALAACNKPSGGAGDSCKADGDCKNGFLCESGACMAAEAAQKIRSLAGTAAAAATLAVTAGAMPGAAAAGPTCAKAAACCLTVSTKSGAPSASCANLTMLPEASCAPLVETYEKAAKALGVVCGSAAPAAEGATAATEPSAEAPAADGPIPAIPEGRSPPPQGTEWDQGVLVNTQNKFSQPNDCTMRLVREWVRVQCGGNVLGTEEMKNFGTKSSDYFESLTPGKSASYVVRARQGNAQTIRICRETDRASFAIEWPMGKDRPTNIALGTGPACDGSKWGTPAPGDPTKKVADEPKKDDPAKKLDAPEIPAKPKPALPPCTEACGRGPSFKSSMCGMAGKCPGGYRCEQSATEKGTGMCLCQTPCAK